MAAKAEKLPVAAQDKAPAITPMQMLQVAVEQNADLDKLQQLMDLQERWEAANAKKAYVAAMQQFAADPPTIVKNKRVAYKNTEYRHATHDQVANVIGEALANVGISFRWDTTQDDGVIAVTCILTHVEGHSEQVTMRARPDDSGSKNSIQAIGSTVTYLQRYTLQSITGIAAQDDDDARGAESAAKISDKQLSTLTDMIAAVEADEAKFLAYLGVDALADLPARQYQQAVAALKAKEKAGR